MDDPWIMTVKGIHFNHFQSGTIDEPPLKQHNGGDRSDRSVLNNNGSMIDSNLNHYKLNQVINFFCIPSLL